MTTSSGPAVPFLSRGAHLSAEEGMCLMEAVSETARLPWSDDPPCTHPLLAHLARAVNDASSDHGRQELNAVVSDLASAAPGDAARAAQASARVAVACTGAALELRASPLLNHLHRVAAAQLVRESRYSTGGSGRFARTRRRMFERGPGARAIEEAASACLHVPPAGRDAALRELLRVGIAAATSRPRAVPAPRLTISNLVGAHAGGGGCGPLRSCDAEEAAWADGREPPDFGYPTTDSCVKLSIAFWIDSGGGS